MGGHAGHDLIVPRRKQIVVPQPADAERLVGFPHREMIDSTIDIAEHGEVTGAFRGSSAKELVLETKGACGRARGGHAHKAGFVSGAAGIVFEEHHKGFGPFVEQDLGAFENAAVGQFRRRVIVIHGEHQSFILPIGKVDRGIAVDSAIG